MGRAETETSAQSMIAFRQADYDIFNLKVPPSNISGRRFLIRSLSQYRCRLTPGKTSSNPITNRRRMLPPSITRLTIMKKGDGYKIGREFARIRHQPREWRQQCLHISTIRRSASIHLSTFDTCTLLHKLYKTLEDEAGSGKTIRGAEHQLVESPPLWMPDRWSPTGKARALQTRQ